jgi:Tfp pilus assembly PilM family ATPase
VCAVHRNGQAQREIICFAIAKDTVMKYIDLLRRCKLEVVGVHTDTMAMIRSFDHINRRTEDAGVATLFVDLGWGGTRAAITHGQQIVFARYIPIGGKHFDQQIASALHCDLASARAHRLTLQSARPAPAAQGDPMHGMPMLSAGVAKGAVGGQSARGGAASAVAAERRGGNLPPSLNSPMPGVEAPRKAVNVDMSELLDTITDELSMCLRYHQSLFGDRHIDRAIFVGGESRQTWLCQHIVKVLELPAQMGDPIARLDAKQAPNTPNLTLGQPQPGWAVPCGLCSAPTDL